ncbi:hypothetical protein [Kangiella sediminilitoris]|uniref:Lipoprotein n=1 Tax=Kangiella sediminilitoris TaxID=1144748 RepID=A0A1B3BCK6_9GAMM|nr:hypothetical protein [Kangiella sediminilitoris]AOE50544.1 hypothetical protein KS2013_1835 [Kangiella sediminilitoris]
MKNLKLFITVLGVFLLTACATRLTKPQGPALPPKVPFDAFQKVVLYPITINPEFADSSPNIDAQTKMNEYLVSLLRVTFSDKEYVIADEDYVVSASDKRTLVLSPRIKEIKYINTAARIFAGAMAGGTAVLMDVKFEDATNDVVLSQPEFYADASAWSGWGADNKVLNRVIEDINHYTKLNR